MSPFALLSSGSLHARATTKQHWSERCKSKRKINRRDNSELLKCFHKIFTRSRKQHLQRTDPAIQLSKATATAHFNDMRLKSGTNLFVALFLIGSLISLFLQSRAFQGVKNELEELRRRPARTVERSTQPQPVMNEVSIVTNEQKVLQPEASEHAAAQSHNLQQEKEQLGAKVKELEATLTSLQQELADAKSKIPGEEDGKAAYFGPGTWIASDPATREIKTVVISGSLPTMTIQVWGSGQRTDSPGWGQVPFFPLSQESPSPKMPFWRGFAVWEWDPAPKKYVIVTFETSGLRVEVISIGEPMYPERRQRSVQHLVRVN